MKAILEVKKGEQPYQVVRSPWLKDKDGDVLFKMLSKKKADEEIEAAIVVERRGHKTVLGRTTCSEEKFPDAVGAFRQMVWEMFPKVDLTVEDIAPVDVDKPNSNPQYTAVKANKRGFFWLRVKRWLRR